MPNFQPLKRPQPSRSFPATGLALCVAILAACGGEPQDAPPPMSGMDAPAAVAERPAPSPVEVPEGAPTVVFLGDSVAAGLHLARHEAFPAVLQRKLAKSGLPFRLVNAGVSGDTTSGGAARVDWLLKQEPDLVVVELGANDGFRGIPLETVERNLRGIVERVRETGAGVLLLGVRLPPNYGPEYVSGFDAVYGRVANDLDVPYLPYFMEGVGGVPDMNLPDGIHPTPQGHERLAENIEQALAEALRARAD